MSRRWALPIALFSLMCATAAIAAQDDSTTPRTTPDSATSQRTPADSTAANSGSAETPTSNQPQIIVNPPPAPVPEWGWREQVAWGATIVLAVLGYVGIMLALRTLKSIDRRGRVIYVGTFSKVMLPTLRLAFIVAPPSIRHAVRSAKFVSDWHTALPTQAALAAFIEEGTLVRHVSGCGNEDPQVPHESRVSR